MAARAACGTAAVLYDHGFPLLEEDPPAPPPLYLWAGGRTLPADWTVAGLAFTDGAVTRVGPASARRGGWAYVVVGVDGLVIYGAYGPVPERRASPLRAELLAVRHALQMAVGR